MTFDDACAPSSGETMTVEHGTFSALVFSSTGGMGRQAITTYKRLASLIVAIPDAWADPAKKFARNQWAKTAPGCGEWRMKKTRQTIYQKNPLSSRNATVTVS